MAGPHANARVKQLLQSLTAAVTARSRSEHSLQAGYQAAVRAEQQQYEIARQQRVERYESERRELQAEYDRVCAEAGSNFAAHYSAASEEYDETLRAVNQEYEIGSRDSQQAFEETRWMVVSYFDENAGSSPKQQFEQFQSNHENSCEHLATVTADLSTLRDSLIRMLKRSRMWTEPEQPVAGTLPSAPDALLELIDKAMDEFHTSVSIIRRRVLPKLFAGLLPVVLFLISTALLAGGAWLVIDPTWLGMKTVPPIHEWVALLALAGVVVSVMLFMTLFFVARSRTEADVEMLQQSFVDTSAAYERWTSLTARELKRRQREFEQWYDSLVKERDSRLETAQRKFDSTMAMLRQQRTDQLQSANKRYPALMEKITAERDGQLRAAESEYPPRLEKLQARYEWDVKKLEESHATNLEACRQRFDIDWQSMAQNWHQSVDNVRTMAQRLNTEAAAISSPWPELAFGHWNPPVRVPSSLRLGRFTIRLGDLEHGVPTDDRLVPEQTEWCVPATAGFPDGASLVLDVSGHEGRQAAVQLLQTAMLRLLMTLPAGKVRFVLIDPIGLGENFSAFMHLADYDELLVTSRIWTESSHIEQRLADLTEHMETVFQTYLRNEFNSIEEYNEFAGEVAEPYRILVIAGFPSGFSEQSARRLTSIMSSGPRCGVYTLLSVDHQLSPVSGFNLDDAAVHSTRLVHDQGRFIVCDNELGWLPFEIDAPPPPDEFGRIVKRAGDASRNARRVEVAFDRVMPRQLWQQDSRGGIDVPLGRAGATKLQHMRLGKGTSQHVLIAGKTGSGKSTLMHILITNIALHYAPDEVQFYLIDFKKGVEFKAYANGRLPHARVIAIESDREFGLSVLQRLDAVLKERGDAFRDAGVQDVAAFRDAFPGQAMPRLLLLIDEFQEFFTEDDRLAQQASLLLDRLVRQGRAFGIHVILGSQTLGGAYSLARSTLGQVAVRIALQCSESDAHLILSEDNTAARLLTRPGEAIYNDANGLLQGNHPFQVAWLDDERRDQCLQQLVDHLPAARGAGSAVIAPPIVFEGNVPADLVSNHELLTLADEPATQVPSVVDAWLGEAVAIKPHTEVRFRRMAGSGLLIVGQDANASRGILGAVLTAAALQVPVVAYDSDATGSETSGSDGGRVGMDSPTVHTSPVQGSQQSAPQQVAQNSMQDAIDALKSFSLTSVAGSNSNSVCGEAGSVDDSAGTVPKQQYAQFYILDGQQTDAADPSFWARLTAEMPQAVRIGGPGDAAGFMNELLQLVRQRNRQPESGRQWSPVFLVIDQIGRFRDLRRSDDDFGFATSRNAGNQPGQQFVELLRSGPQVGVHPLIWSDTFNNASRWMTTQTMRELETRVAFQMNATDSSNFIGSPAAGRLGPNRALLYLEEQGTQEKFRPYGPSVESVKELLRRQIGMDHVDSIRVDDIQDDAAEYDSDDSDVVIATADDMGFEDDPDEDTSADGLKHSTAERAKEQAKDKQEVHTDEAGDDFEVCDDLSSWTVL